MRVYKNGWFSKFARKERIRDVALCAAIHRAEQGLIDADLGGGVIKQRVARDGEGKSGGYRTLIFFRQGEMGVFTFGFAKSDRANLNEDELAVFKKAARLFLELTQAQIKIELEAGRLLEVHCGDEDL
jgi:hypothetical protein